MLLALGGLVGCDHATKHWAEAQLRGAPRIDVVAGVLDLRYAANHDVAFSLLRQVPSEVRTPLVLVLPSLATAAVILLLVRRRRGAIGEVMALTLILAGAVGNLGDRFVRGYVVDFIHLEYWPVFNVADVWVTVGVALLLLSRARPVEPEPPPIDPSVRATT
jgi:signal peptidase II